MRLKAIWCLIWHRHQIFEGKSPSAKCRRCGMYFRDGESSIARRQRKVV